MKFFPGGWNFFWGVGASIWGVKPPEPRKIFLKSRFFLSFLSKTFVFLHIFVKISTQHPPVDPSLGFAKENNPPPFSHSTTYLILFPLCLYYLRAREGEQPPTILTQHYIPPSHRVVYTKVHKVNWLVSVHTRKVAADEFSHADVRGSGTCVFTCMRLYILSNIITTVIILLYSISFFVMFVCSFLFCLFYFICSFVFSFLLLGCLIDCLIV